MKKHYGIYKKIAYFLSAVFIMSSVAMPVMATAPADLDVVVSDTAAEESSPETIPEGAAEETASEATPEGAAEETAPEATPEGEAGSDEADTPAETPEGEAEETAQDNLFYQDWLEGTGDIPYWITEKSQEGYSIKLYVATTSWTQANISLQLDDDSQSEDKATIIYATNQSSVLNSWWAPIEGSAIVTTALDEGFLVEMLIPDAYFDGKGFSLTLGSSIHMEASETQTGETDIPADDKLQTNEENKEIQKPIPDTTVPKDTLPAGPSGPYEGISVDGSFEDWLSTPIYPGNMDGLLYSSFVYDGDMLYFYFEFTENNNRVTWTGPNSNGKFSIKNNMGEEMLFQLTQEPSNRVAGVEGASFAANSENWEGEDFVYKWEIGIPASNLPGYGLPGHNDTLSFGYYLVETPIVENISNISGDSSQQPANPGDNQNPSQDPVDKPTVSPPGSVVGGNIECDGNFDDWESFPKTTLQYKTAGTEHNSVDAVASLCYDEVLHGYVQTTIPEHLQEAGGEFTSSTVVTLNNSSEYTFRAQYVAVDSQGNINYNPQLSGLPYGTYEFYLIDASGWKTAENIADWERDGDIRKGTNAVYGKAYINVGPSSDRMEYYVDVEKLTAKFGMQPDEAKTFSGLYERLGQETVNCAGASSGPVTGILLCLMTSGTALWFKRKEKED